MTPDLAKEIQEWLDYAWTDYDVALFLYENRRPQPLEIICYHCQQSAEKAIKALYIMLELPGGIPRKHDLSFLLNQMQARISIPKEIRQCADMLNVYGIAARYPTEIPVDGSRTILAVRAAKSIFDWAKEQINKPQLP